jgi:hypothetical protein
MTKLSDLSALTGASVDAAADLIHAADMSETGVARSKKMTFAELKVAIGAYMPGGTDVALADGGTGASTAATARTNLGATTVGANVFTLTNPSAITFLRVNADNTVDALSASAFRSAIGAGTGTGGVIEVLDEGVSETATLVSLDFVGAGVSASDDGSGNVTVTVSGSGGGGGGLGGADAVPTDFSLSNTGSGVTLSTTLDSDRGLTVIRTDTGTAVSDRMGFYGKALPGGSFTATMRIWYSAPFKVGTAHSFLRPGLTALENATGKAVHIGSNTQGGALKFSSYRMTNLNTFGATLADSSDVYSIPDVVDFKIVHDGTNYDFSYSVDGGITWASLGTVTKATAFTTAADRIGIGLVSYGSITASSLRATVTDFTLA